MSIITPDSWKKSECITHPNTRNTGMVSVLSDAFKKPALISATTVRRKALKMMLMIMIMLMKMIHCLKSECSTNVTLWMWRRGGVGWRHETERRRMRRGGREKLVGQRLWARIYQPDVLYKQLDLFKNRICWVVCLHYPKCFQQCLRWICDFTQGRSISFGLLLLKLSERSAALFTQRHYLWSGGSPIFTQSDSHGAKHLRLKDEPLCNSHRKPALRLLKRPDGTCYDDDVSVFSRCFPGVPLSI